VLQTPRSEKKDRERSSRHWSWYFPAACGEDHTGADAHTAAHGGPQARAGGQSLKELWLWRAGAPDRNRSPGQN